MTDYPYTKSGVNVESLTSEIESDGIIATDLLGITFNPTEDLTISFDGSLSGPEETQLDVLVAAHSGTVFTTYRMACGDCSVNCTTRRSTTPTNCPLCDGVAISDISEQEPFSSSTSPDATVWLHFQDDDGSLLTAKQG